MKILLIGTGEHSLEYIKILKYLKLEIIVLGNKEESCIKFKNETGISAIANGPEYFLNNISDYEDINYAIITISQSVLCNITLKIIKLIKTILIEKPGGINYIKKQKIAHVIYMLVITEDFIVLF